ncbi:hypothetical protein TRVL_08579 [Trypanosoma vivax]|nr:hypothetical protein TRVL_08579 [Trypanosoma vivax]
MLSLLRRTRICMSGNKIPFVLCGSRFAPAALHSQEISIDPAVKRELRETLLVPPKFSISPNAPAKKKPKRPALDALAHWCGAHQQEALQLQTSTSEIDEFVNETPLRDVDDAAFQWLHGAVHHLSGEQLLLVCSFVCEVLYCRLSTSVAGAGAKPDVFVRKHLGLLLNRIASLLGRIDADIRPEAQPLSALMSCLYSVQRLASCESPLLDEPEKALIRAPPSLFFAILHKLRGGELGKLFQHEADIAVDVCLSFLFVADEERRQAYFSRRDGTIVAIVLRRLIRYITPLLKDIKVAPAEVSESLVVGQDEGSDAAGGGHQLHGAGSPTMSECVTIMKNITFSPPSSRLKLLSYLLRVRRDPAHYSSDDLRLLVKVLDTISSIQSQDASGVRAEIIAPLNLPEGDPLLVAQLLSYSEVGMSRHTEYLNSASLSNVSSEDAKQVVRMAGAHLEFSALQRYIAVALAHPTLAAAFLPAATAVSVLPASSKGKIALCETMEQFLLILLQRLENVGDDTESESSDGELRDKMREYISLLCDLVDWTAVTLPATPTLALQRLCLFTRLAANGYHVHTPTNIVDLAMKSLQHEATKTMVDTLNAVSKALPLVTDFKERRTILEKMLDYNGSRSTSSAYRFLTLLAPMATMMNVCKSDLVRQITNLQTLNPHKLRQIGIESQQEGISTFSVILTNAIDFILASVEWRTDTAHQRDVITLWVTDYVFYAADLAKSRKQVTTTSALRANDEKEGQKEEEKESEEESVLPTPSVALDMAFEPGPSTEELERVFVSMLRSGVRLPDIFIPELSFRIQRLQKRGPLLTEGDAGTRFLPRHTLFLPANLV